MAERKDGHTTGTFNGFNWAGAADWEGMTFKATSDYKATSIKLRFSRNGNPGTITVSLRDVSGGLPTGGDLISGTTPGNSLPAYPTTEDREIPLIGSLNLANGVTYAICFRCVTSGNILAIRNEPGATYLDGTAITSANSGGTWAAESFDLWFEVWGEDIKPPGGGGQASQMLQENLI